MKIGPTLTAPIVVVITLHLSFSVHAQTAADAILGDYEKAASKDIETFCAHKWPTDFSMQNDCFEAGVEARDSAQKFDAMKSNETAIIWANCSIKWSDSQDRVDWVMMDHCLTEQSEALAKINKRKKSQ